MLHRANVLVAASLLLPLVCHAQVCKAESCHDEETSLVQVKASVNLGNGRTDVYPGSNNQLYGHSFGKADDTRSSAAFAGSRRRFTATNNLESLGNQAVLQSRN